MRMPTALLPVLLVGTVLAGPRKAPDCAPDSETALKLARTRGKLIFLTVIVDHDNENRAVVDNVFHDRAFLRIAKEFVCVYANPEDEHGKVRVKGPDGKRVVRCADCPSITCEQHFALAQHWSRGFFPDQIKTPIHFVIDRDEEVVEMIFNGTFEDGFNHVPAKTVVTRLKKILAKHGRGLSEQEYARMLVDLADARAARARGKVGLELEKLLAVSALKRKVEGVEKANARIKEIDALAAKELEKVEALVAAEKWEEALDAMDALLETYKGTPTAAKAAERRDEILRLPAVKKLLKAADLYERGLQYKKRGKLDLARKKFAEVVRRFGDTKYGPLAQKELDALGGGKG